MAYLIERKSQTIFATATSIIAHGKPREVVIRSRPQYAVVQLLGIPEKFPVPWEEVYAAAKESHEANLQIERTALNKRKRSTRQKVSHRRVLSIGNDQAVRQQSPLGLFQSVVHLRNEIVGAEIRIS